jgi:hypothetical protein
MEVKTDSFEDEFRGKDEGAAKQQPEKGKYSRTVSRPNQNDILNAQLKKMKDVAPAPDLDEPVKRGKYEARVFDLNFGMFGENETPGIRVCFKILQGDYAGRYLRKTVWLTDRASALASRDLGKLGITSADDINNPELKTYLFEIRVVVNENDYNEVTGFKVIGRCDAVPVHPAFPPACDSSKED